MDLSQHALVQKREAGVRVCANSDAEAAVWNSDDKLTVKLLIADCWNFSTFFVGVIPPRQQKRAPAVSL